MVKSEISLEEMKQIEVDILLNIDSFCKENGIKYGIGYGTLIGAVRHHGFIPWDDDIDIWMPRPDYDKFINYYQDPTYQLQCMEKGGYYRTYAKVFDTRTIITNTNNKDMGIFVDIIPIDGLPSNEDTARKYLSKMVKIRTWIYKIFNYKKLKIKRLSIRSLVLYPIAKIIPSSFLLSIFLRLSKKYSFKNSSYVAGFAVGPESWLFERSFLEDVIDLEFEGHMVKAPLNYDKFLRVLYGDYMKLPPLEEQIPKHAYHAYWK